MDASSVRILWQKAIDIAEQTEDFLQQFEGSSKDSPIFVINDTSAGKGLKLRVTVRAGYYGPGKTGDDLFNANTDYEQDLINHYEVDLDYLRNATTINQRTDEYMGMQGELNSGQVEELGKWMGREKTARAFMSFRLKGGAQNLIFSNRKTIDTLVSADGLTYNDILYMGQALKPLGGTPASVATVRGVPVRKYIVIGATPGLFSLKQDSDYKLIVKDAMPREKWDENPLFQGGYAELDGHSIREFNPIDHDGYGPVGSPMNAKAFLGAAITAGTAAFTMYGGGSATAAVVTNSVYFRYFEGYAFPFIPGDTYTPVANTTRYLLVINPSNATTDPGKFSMYSYTTGNTGNTIAITGRLGPSNAGIQVSTLGSVTWNAGVWATVGHTQNNPIGATVVQCNAYGTPIGRTFMLGARAMIRGYGMWRNHRSQMLWEGDFQTRKFITSVFGQTLRTNANGVIPGYVQMVHALSYPELGIPPTV